MINADNIVVGKSEGKRQSGRPRSRWEDNIRMDLREIGWEVVDWIHVTKRPVADSCEHDNEPLGSVKGGKLLD
jgi:hypothetical protein